ncbi:MAG: hypothetical protein N2316_11375, partial [Spirochaetes bacterium]|nr:hypothetical protein [Spirochaetota bacterium]
AGLFTRVNCMYSLKQEGKYRCSHETMHQWIYKSIHSGKPKGLPDLLFLEEGKATKTNKCT